MHIVTFNVNGLRAAWRKGFADWLAASDADVVGLQEVRATADQLPPGAGAPAGWWTHLSPAERPGYSGVMLLARRAPDALETTLGDPAFDPEGRVQIARFGRLTIANVYFPNGSGTERDNGRVPFKLAFYRALFDRLEPLRAAGEPVVVMGDWNTAPRPIDLARPKANEKTSGFLPVEREEVARWHAAGWTDAFRHLHGDVPGAYTWWSQRGQARARNVGWRLDYHLLSPGALPLLRAATIEPTVTASDHCPAGIRLEGI